MTRMVSVPRPPLRPPKSDPFRYGWRYVRRKGRNGQEVWDQVPLTLEDVLHPKVEDFIEHSTAHERDREYLHNVLEARRKSWRKRAVVLSDCRVAWDIKELRAHGPDVAVIFGVRNPDRDWSTFDVTAEGVRPILVLEITSPETRYNDLVTKVKHYHRAGVKQYVIVDADERPEGRQLTLIGYRHAPEGYEAMSLDSQGRLPLLGLGLLLMVRGARVVLCDAKTGEELGDYDEVCRALEAAKEARLAMEESLGEAVEARRVAKRARVEMAVRVADLEGRVRELEQRLKPSSSPSSSAEARH
jgi:Uma2 family endonuclease